MSGPALLELLRDPAPPRQRYTSGVLNGIDLAPLFTLELPWRDNEASESCIPPGEYKVALAWSNRYQTLMPRLLNVPDREGILIHPGNTTADTHGCILVGTTRSPACVYNSKHAFRLLFDWLGIAYRVGDVSISIREGLAPATAATVETA